MSLAHIARDYCCVLLSLNAVLLGAESPNRDPSLEVACPAHFFLDQFTPVIYISYLLRRPDRTRGYAEMRVPRPRLGSETDA